MAGPCENCCRGRAPCLGNCNTSDQVEGVYKIEVSVWLTLTVPVSARSVAEAVEKLKARLAKRGLRELARAAWQRGTRSVATGKVTVPFPPGHKPRTK